MLNFLAFNFELLIKAYMVFFYSHYSLSLVAHLVAPSLCLVAPLD